MNTHDNIEKNIISTILYRLFIYFIKENYAV